MIFILYIPIVIYSILWILLLIGCFKQNRNRKKHSNGELSITIIIPFRNELLRWENTLRCLQNLDDSAVSLTVFFVNDHSDDGSLEFLKKWTVALKKSNMIFDLPRTIVGKKAAIEYGVKKASSTWIFTLDADSYIAPNFLNDLKSNMQIGKKMYLFPVNESKGGVFLSSIESSILSSITYSCLGFNTPLLANGAGVMYERELFLELDPYKSNSKYASGDDLFLLSKVIEFDRTLISGFNQKELTVYTTPPQSYKEMIFRAVRWASKMRKVNNKYSFFVGVNVVLCNIMFIPIIIFHIKHSFIISLLVLLFGKFVLDVLLLSSNKTFSFTYSSITHLTLTYFFYPFHLLNVITYSIFKTANWKGRPI